MAHTSLDLIDRPRVPAGGGPKGQRACIIRCLVRLVVCLVLLPLTEGQQQQSTLRVSPAQLLSYATVSSQMGGPDGLREYVLDPGLEVQLTVPVLSSSTAQTGILSGSQQHVVLRGPDADTSSEYGKASINLSSYKAKKPAFAIASGGCPAAKSVVGEAGKGHTVQCIPCSYMHAISRTTKYVFITCFRVIVSFCGMQVPCWNCGLCR